MLCIEQIKSNIVSEIKFNPAISKLTQAYFADKEVIALDINFNFFDYYGYGTAKLEHIRRTKEIHYILSRSKMGLHLTATHSTQHPDIYRTRMTGIWDYYRDFNKISEDIWRGIIKRLTTRHSRFRSNESVCVNYVKQLEMWLSLASGTNYFTEELAAEINNKLTLAKQTLETFKVEEDASATDVLPSSEG